MTSLYVETWKTIGRALGRSERWCRYMARGPDPLPVFKVGGIVRVQVTDLDAWLERQRDRSIARDVDPRRVEAHARRTDLSRPRPDRAPDGPALDD